jgi:hypothetical protein
MPKIIVFFLLCSSVSIAQRFEVLSGSLSSLKGIDAYNITFDYSGQQIYGFESEEAFLQDKMAKREKTQGKAEKFRDDWFSARDEKYAPRFIAYFNEHFSKGEIRAAQNAQLRFTMHIQTTWLYPGYGIGVGGEPAKITAVITIYETANPANILFSIKFDKAIGHQDRGFMDPGDRISGAYEKLAKNMVLQLKRNL